MNDRFAVMDVPSAPREPSLSPRTGVLAALFLGYIGIYLCRKNLPVAVPLLQDAFHANKEQVGWLLSFSTLAYLAGKLTGPFTDRIGGRRGFLLSLFGVALFSAAGVLAPGLFLLTVVYSLSRFFGAIGWGAMMKLVPTWYHKSHLATVVAILSLSYVSGGSGATLLARQVIHQGGGWRAVLGVPSLVLMGILLIGLVLVRKGPLSAASPGQGPGKKHGAAGPSLGVLLRRPQFIIVCLLSFTLTLLREAFNNWSIDFLASMERGGAHGAGVLATAALRSISFDLAGGVSILLMGVVYDRVPPALRRWLIAGILGLLAALILLLHPLMKADPARGAALVGLVGLLIYGPYSLLAGVFAIESGGQDLAATASGIIDAVGYAGGFLAGGLLGRLLDLGGYPLGFRCLAGITLVAAVISLGLRPSPRPES